MEHAYKSNCNQLKLGNAWKYIKVAEERATFERHKSTRRIIEKIFKELCFYRKEAYFAVFKQCIKREHLNYTKIHQ